MENMNNILYQARFLLKTNWLQAVKILEDALIIYPDYIELYLELAEIYTQKEAYSTSLEYLKTVIKLDPNNSIANFKIGNTFLELNNPEQALYHYEQIKDNFPEAIFNTAIAYRELNKTPEAINILLKLIKHPGRMLESYNYLIELLIHTGKHKEALMYANEAEKIFGSKCSIHYQKALIYAHQDNLLGAYTEYLKASKDDKEYPNIHNILLRLSLSMKQTDNALKHLKDAHFKNPKDTKAIFEFVDYTVNENIVCNFTELVKLLYDFDDDFKKIAIDLYIKAKHFKNSNRRK